MAFAAWVLRAFVWRALSAFFSLRPIQARVSRRITFARRGPGKSSASCQEVREPALRHQRWRRSAPRQDEPGDDGDDDHQAADGALARVRLPGGFLGAEALAPFQTMVEEKSLEIKEITR